MHTTTLSEPATTQQKQIVSRLFDSCLNQHRDDLFPELVAADFIGARGEIGPTGLAENLIGLRTGFPDIHYTIEDIIAENDRVAVRWRWEGTHSGPYRNFPPNGKHVTSTGQAIFQIHDGKITRAWTQIDQLGFLQQLGALPEEIAGPPQSR